MVAHVQKVTKLPGKMKMCYTFCEIWHFWFLLISLGYTFSTKVIFASFKSWHCTLSIGGKIIFVREL